MKVSKDMILWGVVGVGAIVIGLMVYGIKGQMDRRSAS